MTADLVLVTAHDTDADADVAVWTAGDGAAVLYMTRERARQLTDTTRELLRQSGANLAELREGSAHFALGYVHWHEYVEREFGDLFVYKLASDRAAIVAERQALVASLTIAGYTVREQRDALGASLGTVHSDQRALGLVPDRPSPIVTDEPEPVDPFRGLSPRWEVLARVAAQGARGLTSLELDAELDRPLGTATGALSKLSAPRLGLLELGTFDEARGNRRPYRVTDAGRLRLAEVIAARDAAELG
jgi:predicted pyridoxine 5'-phosphate oxidase superfamily flavin-nucleotide-binding protein